MIDDLHFAALCAELNGLTSTQQQIALNKYVRSNSGVICQFINELAMLFEDWKKVLSAIPPAQIYVVDKLKVDQMPTRRKRYDCNLQINILKILFFVLIRFVFCEITIPFLLVV